MASCIKLNDVLCPHLGQTMLLRFSCCSDSFFILHTFLLSWVEKDKANLQKIFHSCKSKTPSDAFFCKFCHIFVNFATAPPDGMAQNKTAEPISRCLGGYLSFARNRSRWLRRPLSRLGQSCKHVGSRCFIGSAIDASIIALAYSRFSVGECRGMRYGLLLLNISISASKYAMASFMYGWIRGTMMAMKFSMPSSSTTAVLMT